MRLLLCVTAILVLAQNGPAPAQVVAPNELRGTWVVVETEYAGKKSKTTNVWTFHDGTLSRKSPTSKISKGTTSNYQIDATKTPKTIDLMSATGKVMTLGIYEVNGDTLKVCYVSATKAGQARPTAFATMAGDNCFMYTLQRQK
jgi:uncharacterized protein (TIGR03067 family)